ncbi:MAG: ribosome biogenesis GTPase Der [Alphaproteobacteria bacterium]|nr:ribosome biogenesis GTPase Der [Alphaproteobacteria bacterium]
MPLSIAIIGRPNVGKSTIFNRLARKKMALIDNTPGVTRDWRETEGTLYDLPLRLIDTAGLEDAEEGSLQDRMRERTEAGVAQAEVVLFVIDGRQGLLPDDHHFGEWARKCGKPVILLANKCESEKAANVAAAEAYQLGLGDPIIMSAAHGHGFDDLYERLREHARDAGHLSEDEEDDELAPEEDLSKDVSYDALEGDENFEFQQEELDPEKPIKVAIVGRPNAGKSTLLNALLGYERVLTGPEAGITRDAIAVQWEYGGKKIRLVDTAGIRKKAKVEKGLEYMAVGDSLRAIRLAQVVILVVDATMPLEKQDLTIAQHVLDEGRALIIAVNKWDAVEDKTETLEDVKFKIMSSLAQVKGLRFVTMSAIRNKNLSALMEEVISAFAKWQVRISTGKLNKWLGFALEKHAPPLVDGRTVKIRFMTQIKARPPTFLIWASKIEKLPDEYVRYLKNALAENFDLEGVPLRLYLRKSKNPYID